MQQERAIKIHDATIAGDCVVYIMSRDQRVFDNYALLFAQDKANELKLPLVVLFELRQKPGLRAYEHAEFMLKGLKLVMQKLNDLNITFVLTVEKTSTDLLNNLSKLNPAVLYFDFSPLKNPRSKAKTIAKKINKTTFVVDTHNIIPVWVASDHQEFAAHTFRHKVYKNLSTFLVEPKSPTIHNYKIDKLPKSLSFDEAYKYLNNYPKRELVFDFKPGEDEALKRLQVFINNQLSSYATERNNIADDSQSGLSPYLHFGQISSQRVAFEVMAHVKATPLLFELAKMANPDETPSKSDGMNALFEEMIVRKELSDNFCFYAKSYRSFDSVPEWAKVTLKEHSNDIREHKYNLAQLESGQTHDIAWNAAQKELTKKGKIHGYMRMYWAKKILEWTKDPEEALKFTTYLNDSYSLDGGDPNGYVGILWSIAGLHDRPWTERPIFGKIRYMNEAGLKRKFDIEAYIKRVEN